MSDKPTPLEEFHAELNRTGVLSDAFKRHLRVLVQNAVADAYARGVRTERAHTTELVRIAEAEIWPDPEPRIPPAVVQGNPRFLTGNYVEAIDPDYLSGERLSVAAYLLSVITDSDGYGYPSNGTHLDVQIPLRPSEKAAYIPSDATHVVWMPYKSETP